MMSQGFGTWSATFKKSGYTTLEAEDGAQALEQFNSNPDTALIILDVMMPEINGWDVCKRSGSIPISPF